MVIKRNFLNIIKILLGRQNKLVLPDYSDPITLASTFNMYFTVSMTLVIIIRHYEYCQIALYKMNCIVLLLLYMYIVYYSPLNLLDIGL